MSFKAQIAKDIDGVFINALEFAEAHDIDGAPVVCVLDTDVTHERRAPVQNSAAGIQIALHIAADKLSTRPVSGQIMRIDGEIYVVQNVSQNMGLYYITMEATT